MESREKNPASEGTLVAYDPTVPKRLLVPHRLWLVLRAWDRLDRSEDTVLDAAVPKRELSKDRMFTPLYDDAMLERHDNGVPPGELSQAIGFCRRAILRLQALIAKSSSLLMHCFHAFSARCGAILSGPGRKEKSCIAAFPRPFGMTRETRTEELGLAPLLYNLT
mmetsp:Transcript_51645/g.80638  ORF Transcript_51645/g.80638 Transcript_51645/m.80638 type:complete len:165 (+) Transcript_51645:8-502(+)